MDDITQLNAWCCLNYSIKPKYRARLGNRSLLEYSDFNFNQTQNGNVNPERNFFHCHLSHTHTKCLVKRRHTSSLSARTNKLELVFRKKWTESWEIVKNKLTKMFDSRSLCVFQTFFALETILFSRIDILPLLAIARYWRPNKGKEKRNFQHKMKHVLIITKNRYSTQQSFWISGGKKSMSVFSFRIRNNFSCCSHLSICSYLYYSNWQIMQLQATLKGKRSKKN